MSAPNAIRLRAGAQILELGYEDGRTVALPAEFLRTQYPSPPGGKAQLIPGKRAVAILAAAPAGNYALRLVFSDGFDEGEYSWSYLAELEREYHIRWRRYLSRLEEAGLTRG